MKVLGFPTRRSIEKEPLYCCSRAGSMLRGLTGVFVEVHHVGSCSMVGSLLAFTLGVHCWNPVAGSAGERHCLVAMLGAWVSRLRGQSRVR